MAEESGIRGKRTKLNTTTTTQELLDRISELPDSLLLHIMSFLNIKEVGRTCLLSKRWQFLCTDISEINLLEKSWDYAKVRSFVDWVGRMLVKCGGINLNKFGVDFKYDKCFASSVNTWVQFAVENKVKNITLMCHFVGDLYLLPQTLYSHSSLTNLTVCHCVMAPRAAIKWVCLKSLSVYQVALSNCVMENILSSCPVLKVLHLRECWGLSPLNISLPSLTTLVIEHWQFRGGEYFLEISVPYVLDLSITQYAEGGKFRLTNVSSVVRAKLYFDMGIFKDFFSYPYLMNYIKQLLESLMFVKELELGPWCIEVLSALEVEGWQLPQFTLLRCLTLNAYAHTRIIPGIIGILKPALNLETLFIRGIRLPIVPKDTDPVCPAAAYSHNDNMDFVLSHLKTVMITSFRGYLHIGEPMLTLVQVLLKKAKVLEKMIISAKELMLYASSTDLIKISNTLHTFPRASQEAVVVFASLETISVEAKCEFIFRDWESLLANGDPTDLVKVRLQVEGKLLLLEL